MMYSALHFYHTVLLPEDYEHMNQYMDLLVHTKPLPVYPVLQKQM